MHRSWIWGATAGLAVVAASWLWLRESPEERQQLTSKGFATQLEEALAEARATDRHVVLFFDDRDSWSRDRAIRRDVGDADVDWTELERRYHPGYIEYGDDWRWSDLPESIRWCAVHVGGEALVRHLCEVSDGSGDRILSMPDVVVLSARGALIDFERDYQQGTREALMRRLADDAAVADAFDGHMARADQLDGTERAEALLAAMAVLPGEARAVGHRAVIREILALNPFARGAEFEDWSLAVLRATVSPIALRVIYGMRWRGRPDPRRVARWFDRLRALHPEDGELSQALAMWLVLIVGSDQTHAFGADELLDRIAEARAEAPESLLVEELDRIADHVRRDFGR